MDQGMHVVISQEARNLLGLFTIVLCLGLYTAGRIIGAKRGWQYPELAAMVMAIGGAGIMAAINWVVGFFSA